MKVVRHNKKSGGALKSVIALNRSVSGLPSFKPIEQRMLESEQRFDAVYHSNRLEGNRLSREEARQAITLDLR